MHTQYSLATSSLSVPRSSSTRLDADSTSLNLRPCPATVCLNINYPPEYPDVAPQLRVLSPPVPIGMTPYLSLPEDTPTLVSALEETVSENAGMAMIYSVISTLKERCEALVNERKSAEQAQRDQEAAQREEEENRRFTGEKVTRQSFLRWRAGFMRDVQEAEEHKRAEEEKSEGGGGGSSGKTGRREEKRLTGRELWEKGFVGKTDDVEDAVVGLQDDVEKLKVTPTAC